MIKMIIGSRCLSCGHYETTEFSKIDRPISREDIGFCSKCGDDSIKEIMDVEITKGEMVKK